MDFLVAADWISRCVRQSSSAPARNGRDHSMSEKNIHIGSSFDDFLAEDGQLESATSIAINRMISWQERHSTTFTAVDNMTLLFQPDDAE